MDLRSLHTLVYDNGICKLYLLKALKEGDELMTAGRLKQALPYYEKVMQAVDFKVFYYRNDILLQKKCHKKIYIYIYIPVVVVTLVKCWLNVSVLFICTLFRGEKSYFTVLILINYTNIITHPTLAVISCLIILETKVSLLRDNLLSLSWTTC